MQFLQQLFLEIPWRLAVFSFILFAMVLFFRLRLEGRARARAIPLTLGLIVGLFSLQGLVETQPERVLKAFDDFIGGIESQNTSRWSQWISPSFHGENLDRAAVVELVESALQDTKIYDTTFTRRDVDVVDDHATLTLGAVATVSRRGGPGETHTGRWIIEWQREGDDWRIVSLRPVMLDMIPFDSLRQVRNLAP